jgi:ribonuclease I
MLLLIGVTLTGATHTHVHTRDYTLTSATTDANTITTKSSSSSFDFYVLSMSYQPQFCYQNRFKKYHGCEHPLEFWKGSLTLHGLWPEVCFCYYCCSLLLLLVSCDVGYCKYS